MVITGGVIFVIFIVGIAVVVGLRFTVGLDGNSSAAENLAALAETYMRKGFVDEAAVKAEIDPCFVSHDGRQTDIVVLACTHFPFLVNRMRKMAPWPVDWIDPAEAIARRALAIVDTLPGGEALPDARDRVVFTSGDPDYSAQRLMHGFGLTSG